ncbi:MAG TPA: DUF1254 domain-containing protein [Bryobacteraceae bacterium]|nr:DUF1254 domain-containing protein [Bryobacteraceae bacterium]
MTTKSPSQLETIEVTPTEARSIAREAYTYGFPLVDNYRILYSYFVDRNSKEYKGSWNEVHSTARVYTPEDRVVQSPNSDTPYSVIGADLRAEPLVFTVPPIPDSRYFSLQFIDAYTFNFAYAGSRTTGNGGGNFLLAGPRWKGEKPEGMRLMISSETEIALVIYRTQLLKPDDIENVKRIQAGYKVQPLSQFLDKRAPGAPPKIDFPKALSTEEERKSLDFFKVLNFVLKFCPTHPSETALMERFAKLGVGAGKSFDVGSLPPEIRQAIEDGRSDAWQASEAVEKQVATGERTSADLFGSRAYLKDNFLYRMLAAARGIYGNSKEEAIYPAYLIDSEGRKLNGAISQYTLRFAPGQLPPVNAFWSLTMYDAAKMLVPNSLNRYLINSPMVPDLKRDGDGGLTLYVQKESPGKDKESNWLPAPDGPFFMALRLYWPKPEASNGHWHKPPLYRVD